MIQSKKEIHFWFPELFGGIGGIQLYSRFFLKAFFSMNSDPARVFVKTDHFSTKHTELNSQVAWVCCGKIPEILKTPIWACVLFFYGVFFRPKLIICGHAYFSPVAFFLNRLLGIPYWIIVHGTEVWDVRNSLQICGLRSSSRIISVSEYTAVRIREQEALRNCRISLLPNTYREDLFRIEEPSKVLMQKHGMKPGEKMILSVGRLLATDQYKGNDLIIRSLPRLNQQNIKTKYIIVGDGGDKERLEKIAADLHVSDQVIFAGRVSDQDLLAYYNLCDVFAMPSTGEGFGIVYLEALACGKPVLAGQDGAKDALREGELGVLVNPGNQKQVEETLQAMLLKTYPHPMIFQPQMLSKKVKEYFGWQAYAHFLKKLMQESELN